MYFQKWHEEFSTISPEHVRKSKNWDFNGALFIQSSKCMGLKIKRDFCVMKMKNDAKFEVGLTCQSKTQWGIWQILTQTLKNLKNVHCTGLLLTKVHNVWAKKIYRQVMFDGTECWCKVWRKNDLYFQKRHRNLANFYQSMFGSLKIGTLIGSFYPK